jgi:predicted metal-dependent phosphoesterase TrpH
MIVDFHLHTIASDGELDPAALVREAVSRGVGALAITDHDTLAAYRWRGGAVFDEARRLGALLTVGIELDVVLGGREVHLLGLGLDLDAPALGAHLDAVPGPPGAGAEGARAGARRLGSALPGGRVRPGPGPLAASIAPSRAAARHLRARPGVVPRNARRGPVPKLEATGTGDPRGWGEASSRPPTTGRFDLGRRELRALS